MVCRRVPWLVLPLGIAAAATLWPADAGAIPAFARKYRMSCTTCHAPFPRLLPYGEEFAGRGFRLEEAAQEPARARVETGDPLLDLPRDLPLAVRLEGGASWKEGGAAESDVEWPWVWKILSGGPLGSGVSYYFYFLAERGEVVGLEDAYVQFNGPFGAPIDLLVGQFQVSDPMFKREVRLMRDDYAIYKAHVGFSTLDLTYDRGVVLGWGGPGGIDVVAQLVNGNGIPHADSERDFDRDRFKNPSVHVAWERGNVRVGGFFYYGKQTDVGEIDNETYYFGPDVVVTLPERAQLNLQYLERRDDDPIFVRHRGDRYETRGGFAELHVFPQGWHGRWVLSALYNRVDSDFAFAEAETASLTANRLLARNVRLYLDGSRDLAAERWRATLGVVTAF
jgi:hypothetical protein